jgi:hypothetical protein
VSKENQELLNKKKMLEYGISLAYGSKNQGKIVMYVSNSLPCCLQD